VLSITKKLAPFLEKNHLLNGLQTQSHVQNYMRQAQDCRNVPKTSQKSADLWGTVRPRPIIHDCAGQSAQSSALAHAL
jgi:hypothetical protein